MTDAWPGPSHRAHTEALRIVFSYDRGPIEKDLGTSKRSILRIMPQVEKLISSITGVAYKFSNASSGGQGRVFFYISPAKATDYFTFDLKLKGKEINLSGTWTPYQRGSSNIDFEDMAHLSSKSMTPELMGLVFRNLAKKLAIKASGHIC